MSKQKLLLPLATLAAAGIVAGGVAVAGESAAPPQDTPPLAISSTGYASPVQSADDNQRRSFGILRRTRTSKDELTGEGARIVATGAQPAVAANPDLSQNALTTPSGATVWVVPGNGSLCLVSSAGTDMCNTTEAGQAGYVAGVEPVGLSGYRVQGMAPDGVTSTTLELADGTTQRTDVQANVYAFEIPGDGSDIRAVSWSDANGVHRIPLGIPPNA
jgi:hypothetical protein